MNKRGTYGIIADDLRFDTQLSNVYGNAIRAKLAAAQTTRSVPKAVFCFPSLWQSKRKKPNFFTKNDSGKTLAEVTEILYSPLKADMVFHPYTRLDIFHHRGVRKHQQVTTLDKLT